MAETIPSGFHTSQRTASLIHRASTASSPARRFAIALNAASTRVHVGAS